MDTSLKKHGYQFNQNGSHFNHTHWHQSKTNMGTRSIQSDVFYLNNRGSSTQVPRTDIRNVSGLLDTKIADSFALNYLLITRILLMKRIFFVQSRGDEFHLTCTVFWVFYHYINSIKVWNLQRPSFLSMFYAKLILKKRSYHFIFLLCTCEF